MKFSLSDCFSPVGFELFYRPLYLTDLPPSYVIPNNFHKSVGILGLKNFNNFFKDVLKVKELSTCLKKNYMTAVFYVFYLG